ncbi:hypothetical protein C5167_001456 [Papaver somniferum]|uniref:Uncharacterized protein n=1 Tax=Papaver somniferum TaxID=3469 RepID=A0A4Y7KWX9_PAPSO|nr:hypothetical protein C5167_001456 [Papaver somniferum]
MSKSSPSVEIVNFIWIQRTRSKHGVRFVKFDLLGGGQYYEGCDRGWTWGGTCGTAKGWFPNLV